MSQIDSTRLPFYEFLQGSRSLMEFETVLYHNRKLEILFSADDYFDLIEFNFHSPEFKPFVKKLVKKYFDWDEYEKWRTVLLLEKIVTGEIEIVLASREMRQLYLEQQEEIGKSLLSKELALGFESELDKVPVESEYQLWEESALKKQLEEIKSYRSQIIKLAEKELEDLKKESA